MKKITALLAIFALQFPLTAFAERSPLYMNVNAVVFDSTRNTYEPEGVSLGFGWDLNNYLSFELDGTTSDTYEDQPSADTYQVDYAASAFLRFNLRFNRVTLYAMGGYSKIKTTSTAGALTTIQESDGTSYGYGIDFYGTPDLALSIRRIEFIDIDEPAEQVNIGATMLGITYYYDTPRIHSRY